MKLRVSLPILEGRRFGGLHSEAASASGLGFKASLSSGFSLGNAEVYVSVNGERYLSLDCGPLFMAAFDEAIRRWKAARRKRKEQR